MNNIDKAIEDLQDYIDHPKRHHNRALLLIAQAKQALLQAKQDRRETYFFLKSIDPDFLTGRQKIKRKELIKNYQNDPQK